MLRVIQVLLGHTKLDEAARYAPACARFDPQVTSPLDHLIGKIKDETAA